MLRNPEELSSIKDQKEKIKNIIESGAHPEEDIILAYSLGEYLEDFCKINNIQSL